MDKYTVITSTQNEKIKNWCHLHQAKQRNKQREFLVEGEHMIEEAYHAGCLKQLILVEGVESSVPCDKLTYVKQEVMNKLSTNVSETAMMGVCSFPEVNVRERDRVLLLDGLQNPGNIGTLIRTAYAFGYDEVICSMDCADLYNEKTLQATQGAIFHLPSLRTDLNGSIEELKLEGFTIVGTSLQEAVALSTVKETRKMAVVLGNEGNGMRKATMAQCDVLAKIEMKQFESLNVAIAGGILLYQFMKK